MNDLFKPGTYIKDIHDGKIYLMVTESEAREANPLIYSNSDSYGKRLLDNTYWCTFGAQSQYELAETWQNCNDIKTLLKVE